MNYTSVSDVDLLVVGDVGFTEVVSVLYSVREMLGRNIDPIGHKTFSPLKNAGCI